MENYEMQFSSLASPSLEQQLQLQSTRPSARMSCSRYSTYSVDVLAWLFGRSRN